MSDGPRTTLSRRRLLVSAGVAGVGAAAVGCSDGKAASTTTATKGFVPFEGVHQSGIVAPHQQHGLVAAFNVTATNRESLVEMFQSLTTTAPDVMAGRTGEARDPRLPADDNLILSPQIEPDASTVTFAVGESLFDDRYGLSAFKPAGLVRMPSFPNDEPHPESSHGDLVIQICADHDDTCTHALRRLMSTGRKYLTLRWMLSGFVRPNKLARGQTSVRNLLGFKDGTARPVVHLLPGDLAKGFVAVQERLNGEALEEYIKPIGGGFYFVLPGVDRRDGWLAEGLLS